MVEPHEACNNRLTRVERIPQRFQVEDGLKNDCESGDPEQADAVLHGHSRPDKPFASANRRREQDRARAYRAQRVSKRERQRLGQVGAAPGG